MKIVALLIVVSLAVACKDEPVEETPPLHPPIGARPPVASLPDLPSGDISGTLRVSPEMAGRVASGDVVFVMARNAATGSLLAVSRVRVDALPAKFELTGGSAMHGGAALAGKVRVEARVDKDGDPMTKNPGDVIGEVDGLVAVPAAGVVLTLTETL